MLEEEPRTFPKQKHEADLNPNINETQFGNNDIETQGEKEKSPMKELPIDQRKGVRSWTLHPISYFVGDGKLSPSYQAFVANLSRVEVPRNVYEALKQLEWKNAVEEEMRALNKNQTWGFSDLPSGKQPVGCK